jgi:hypothetical protein
MSWLAGFAVAAGILLLLSWALLIVFFVKQNEIADLASNWVGLAALVAVGLSMGAVLDHFATDAPVLVSTVTAIGLLAVAVNLVLTAGLVLRRYEFPRVAMPLTATWAILFLWVGAASGFVLAYDEPAGLGWLGIGTIAYTLVLLAFIMRDPEQRQGTATPPTPVLVAGAPILLLIPAWFVFLGLAL